MMSKTTTKASKLRLGEKKHLLVGDRRRIAEVRTIFSDRIHWTDVDTKEVFTTSLNPTFTRIRKESDPNKEENDRLQWIAHATAQGIAHKTRKQIERLAAGNRLPLMDVAAIVLEQQGGEAC